MADLKSDLRPAQRYRFGVFEADAATGELRRQGMRVKLNAQPFQVLLMLLERPGQLVTRDEISRVLWPEGTFVDYEHGVNSAVNRIREALGDTAGSPRFVETLARRGYRFLAPVEQSIPASSIQDARASLNSISPNCPLSVQPRDLPEPEPQAAHADSLHAGGSSQNVISGRANAFRPLSTHVFGFLYWRACQSRGDRRPNLATTRQLRSFSASVFITAAVLIPARAFVLCAALFHAPGFRDKFLTLWPFLLFFDELWSLSPFLLLHHINFGVALACTALLVYSPFAQRSIVLMGAGSAANTQR